MEKLDDWCERYDDPLGENEFQISWSIPVEATRNLFVIEDRRKAQDTSLIRNNYPIGIRKKAYTYKDNTDG